MVSIRANRLVLADNDCDADCPVRRTADILDGKWTTLIVRELLPGTRRFSQLQRGLPGISPKMLTVRLKMLELNGLVLRVVYPCVPPKTEYSLTPLGRRLEDVIAAMAQFGSILGARKPTGP
jgi:DNA-binding HxlR family transcriptional regulator